MTNKQLFRKPLPNNIIFDLLDSICLKKEKHYIIDINSFKKMVFHQLHVKFFETLKDYYHASKQFYITRDLTYNSFTNIIRQICKANNIMFSSNIRYSESNYNIEYYIYFWSRPLTLYK